ncbi:MAG: hypothetical protein L6Q78_05055 [Bacteroidia bacterium]|nr:hypothetical protein [Bacteroidia bacterium]
MKDLKTFFLNSENISKIPKWANHSLIEQEYLDPGIYLYREICAYSFEEKFSNEFIELCYIILKAWNMNTRGAKLIDFKTFKHSIIKNKNFIKGLSEIKIEDSTINISELEKIRQLFYNMTLVETKAGLVTFSKLIHFFLPELLMPIDRRYTLNFFFGHGNIPQEINKQFDLYCKILFQFNSFAHSYDFNKIKVDRWNWNKYKSKSIDNLIIGYMRDNNKVS